MKARLLLGCLLGLTVGFPAHADVKVSPLFSDGMVLQRDMPIKIWGTAAEGEKVTAQLADQSVATTAQGGKWNLQLPAMSSGGPLTLTLTGNNVVTIQDVLIGEVWVCAGQSNMERLMIPTAPHQLPVIDAQAEVAAADFPQIREFTVKANGAATPAATCYGSWVICSPQTAANFSAVAFFFGRALYQHLHVPVGLIFAAQGGTAAEFWTSQEALDATPELKPIMDQYRQELATQPDAVAQYQKDLPDLQKQYEDALAAPREPGKPPPPPPRPPGLAHSLPGKLFNGYIAPLIPYTIRGVAWYQGETNSGRGRQYRSLLPALIGDWRKRWGEGDFPFLFVQIAPYKSNDPEIREAEMMTFQKTANTGMVVTTDVADGTDLHPPNKRPVGERLALAARALAYGEKLECSGPLFDSMTTDGPREVLHFTHAAGGLEAKDGPLTGFAIAGVDGNFVPADAVIDKDTVIVSSAQVPAPTAVRFGWDAIPKTNLYNKDDLPASPFRTDVP